MQKLGHISTDNLLDEVGSRFKGKEHKAIALCFIDNECNEGLILLEGSEVTQLNCILALEKAFQETMKKNGKILNDPKTGTDVVIETIRRNDEQKEGKEADQ